MARGSQESIRDPRLPESLGQREPGDDELEATGVEIEADFTGRPLPVDLVECRVVRSRFTAGELGPVRITDSTFEDCDLSGAVLRRETLARVSFHRCRMSGVAWPEARLSDVRMTDCKLDEASFRLSVGKRVQLEACLLTGSDFVEVRWTDARLLRCDLRGSDFSKAALAGACLHGSDLERIRGAAGLAGVVIDSTQAIALASALCRALDIVIDDREDSGTAAPS